MNEKQKPESHQPTSTEPSSKSSKNERDLVFLKKLPPALPHESNMDWAKRVINTLNGKEEESNMRLPHANSLSDALDPAIERAEARLAKELSRDSKKTS